MLTQGGSNRVASAVGVATAIEANRPLGRSLCRQESWLSGVNREQRALE